MRWRGDGSADTNASADAWAINGMAHADTERDVRTAMQNPIDDGSIARFGDGIRLAQFGDGLFVGVVSDADVPIDIGIYLWSSGAAEKKHCRKNRCACGTRIHNRGLTSNAGSVQWRSRA